MKISFLDKQSKEVLIFNSNNHFYLSRIIPAYASKIYINERKSFHVIFSSRFILGFIKYLFLIGLKKNLLRAILIYSINPKIVLSNIDNSSLSKLKFFFPDKKFLLIQNGTRFSTKTLCQNYHQMEPDIYYTFGYFEKFFFKKIGLKSSIVKPICSMKLGFFLEDDLSNNHKSNDNVATFVSQFRILLTQSNSNLSGEILDSLGSLYKALALWCKSSDYQLNVILFYEKGSEEMKQELIFYKTYLSDTNVKFIPNSRKNMSSYKLAWASSLVVGLDSTLLFELLALNKRVIIGLSAFPKLYKERGFDNYSEFLPDFMKITNIQLKKFNESVDNLMKIPENEYVDKIMPVRKNFMNIGENFPQSLIKEDLIKILSENEG